ncbi:carbohydrate deacetylase-like [Saccoglossus kowalevskii]|uniref:Carbohydrate deacetylase n=1 Tax=Saccoglossus kowalevskii TaxID=10224 RepID=A0ABM0H110_SACKO|nr:PREDICTED: UPF0249 protein ydjC homolog [Saccoglossus kowalevskii]
MLTRTLSSEVRYQWSSVIKGTVLRQYSMTRQEKLHLVVTGDDFGYCPERNRGIIECFKRGVITGSSLLVNAVGFKDAVKLAKECRLPLGLHLNLTEGVPISGRSSLLDKDGFFLDKCVIQDALREHKINFDEVRNEMRAQIALFRQTLGYTPVYVDGHQHVHVFPGISQVFAEVLKEHNITLTRFPIQYNLEKCSWVLEEHKKFNKVVQLYAQNAKSIFQAHCIRYPLGYIGLSTMGEKMTVDRIESALSSSLYNLKKSKESFLTFELMTHPGYPSMNGYGGCGHGPDKFSCSQDRVHEISILQDERLKMVYKKYNVELCSYKEMFQK